MDVKMRILTALMATTLVAGQAQAQEGSLPVQQFAPAPGGDSNYVSTQGTGTLPALTPAVGVYLNYAHDPLILRRLSNDEQVSLIEHHVQLDLIAALGLFDFLELGVAIPMTLYQAAGDESSTLRPNPVDSFTTGDIRLYPKVSIVHDPEGFGLAFLALVTLPTGSPENLQGNESVTFEPRLMAQMAFGRQFRFGASVGAILRPEKQQLFNIDVGTELTFGLGIEYKIDPDAFAIILEGYGKASLESGTQAEENPIEVALAARYWPVKEHALTLGVARGLTEGYGSPDFRVFLGYNFTSKEDDDPDGDGIRGRDDQCPYEPEDFDKFEDEDGCADLDNDRDGIRDTKDKCPLEPEDYDGFQDEDGCPEPDNDGDGILDADDKCPNDPEDPDGFEDEDGCPDLDNDKDRILDTQDGTPNEKGFGACMNDPEDYDSFEDEDGCPDPDNDGDGILDVDDECPKDPTNACRARLGKCEIQILDQVFFKYDKSEIDEKKSKPILDAVAEVLNGQKWINLVEVQGHTDSDGPDAYNDKLSQDRADAVMAYLTSKGGVDAGRLKAKGYGEKVPLDSNATPAGRAKNRRVQFFILDPSQENCKR